MATPTLMLVMSGLFVRASVPSSPAVNALGSASFRQWPSLADKGALALIEYGSS